MENKHMKFLRNEEGLTTVEYSVAGALVAASLAIAFRTLGLSLGTVIGNIATLVNP